MAVIRFAGFAGENRAVEPKLLGDSVLTVSLNQKPGRGDLRPWRRPFAVGQAYTNTQTIYRMGRDVASDSQYWLTWNTPVHAVRGFSADDTTEQTFYTGDGAPKFTNNVMALQSTPYPTLSRPMGLPAPTTAPTTTPAPGTLADAGKYQLKITDAYISTMIAGDVYRISVNKGTAQSLTIPTLNSAKTITPDQLVSEINQHWGGVTAARVVPTASEGGGITITSQNIGDNFVIEQKVGTTTSYDWEDVTLSNFVAAYAVAQNYTATQYSNLIIQATSMVAGGLYSIYTVNDTNFTLYGASSNAVGTIFVATGPASTGPQNIQLPGLVREVLQSTASGTVTCSLTLTYSHIASLTSNQRIQVKVNNDPAVAITIPAGGGTFPARPTAQSVKSAFANVTGIKAEIITNQGNSEVKLTLENPVVGNSFVLKYITPQTVDNFQTYGTGTEIKLDDSTLLSTYYCYTYANDLGWESAPSPVSAEDYRYAETKSTISGFAAPPSGNYNINKIRIYKTLTGSNTNFYFLREVAAGTTTTEDDNRDIGELLETTNWLPAPGVPTGGSLNTTEPTLSFLTPMWNGMLAGISGNAVRVCEPYAPYAWPKAYEVLVPDGKPVGLGVFGQNLLILTTSRPTLVNGSSPDGLDQQKVEMPQGCVSARSIVSMGAGVAWASEDGLCWFGAGGPRILTAGIMLREDWQAINPNTIIGCMYEGLYFGSYLSGPNGGTRRSFFIDPSNPQGIFFQGATISSMYFDELRDHLYVTDGTGFIKKWDATPDNDEGGTWEDYRVVSKVFKQPYPQSYGAAEVIASGYPVTFRLIADGQQVFETNVQSRAPFRLPAGFRAFDYQIELAGDWPIQGVAVASSMQELSAV